MKKVQFMHPGSQKPFKLNKGYRKINDTVIREWNNDKNHYRKFILNDGCYLDNLNDTQPKQSDLYFWGEWEGNSVFDPLKNKETRIMPNGVHFPYHSTENRGHQNTDPFVYGDCFKYCVCKQIGGMLNLPANSVILFGTTFPSLNKFYIDTVFVVKDFEHSSQVIKNNGVNYTKTYHETTLEQLDCYLSQKVKPSENRIYRSQTWWENQQFFSFVPCKTNMGNNGFERLYLNLDDDVFHLSKNPTGKSFLNECLLSPVELWQKIVEIAISQGFKLAIKFAEPKKKVF